MKISLFRTLALCAAIIGAVAATASEKQPQQAGQTLKEFYTAYAANMAGKGDDAVRQQLFDRYLTAALVEKVRKVGAENGYDLLLRAQDFNAEAVGTIAVTRIEGDWYAVGYLDTYRNSCVLIPVKMVGSGGVFRLGDVKAEE